MQKGHANGKGAPAFDPDAHGDRNVVERSFAHLKQWRGIAAHYDKLAITYRAGVVLHDLPFLGHHPRRQALGSR